MPGSRVNRLKLSKINPRRYTASKLNTTTASEELVPASVLNFNNNAGDSDEDNNNQRQEPKQEPQTQDPAPQEASSDQLDVTPATGDISSVQGSFMAEVFDTADEERRKQQQDESQKGLALVTGG